MIDLILKAHRNHLASKIADLAMREQEMAELASLQADNAKYPNMAAIKLGERDKHVAAAKALVEAARLVMKSEVSADDLIIGFKGAN